MSALIMHTHSRDCVTFSIRQCLLTFCLSALIAGPLAAQPDLPVTQLLFDPVPIPEEGAAESTESFSSLENMPQLVASEDIEETRIDAATRLQIMSDIEGYVSAIGDKEQEEGPYSNQLVQDLFSTALLHQQLENHDQALDFFTRAQNISRINEGLDSIAQAPIIKAKTESLMALGRVREADESMDGLLQIYRDGFGEGSNELVPVMLDLGDWNMDAFLERSNIALISRRTNVQQAMVQGAASGGSSSMIADLQMATNFSDISQPIYKLYLSQNMYRDAINILIKNQNFTHPELLNLERKLLTTSFLRTHQENIVYEPDFYLERKTEVTGSRLDTSSQDLLNSDDYDAGLSSLQRSLTYIVSNEQRTPLQVASALLEEGDWHMLFKRSIEARRKYEEAYAFFAQNPVFGEQIGDYIYPQVPVVLPVFLPAPNSREKLGIAEDEEVNYFGYFDVSFSINRQGKARRIRIREQGGEVTRNMEIRLSQYLRNVLFRPLYDQEGNLDERTLNLRYFVGI